MPKVTDDQLIFEQIRWGTSQWEIYYEKSPTEKILVARVTERIISQPPYVIDLLKAGKLESEVKVDDRDIVCEKIIEFIETAKI